MGENMAPNNDKPINKAVLIGGLCVFVIVAVVGITIWSNKTETPPGKASQEPITVRETPGMIRKPIVESPQDSTGSSGKPDEKPVPETPQPVVDYNRLQKDKNLQSVMEKRKEKYGFEKGVDLIVKPDESVKVGDEVVPMKEILDRIRLKSGEVIEKDLTEPSGAKTAEKKHKEMITELDAAKERYEQLDRMAEAPEQAQNKETKETYIKEREALGKIVSVYKDYKTTTEKIEEKKKLLTSLTETEKTEPLPGPPTEKKLSATPVPVEPKPDIKSGEMQSKRSTNREPKTTGPAAPAPSVAKLPPSAGAPASSAEKTSMPAAATPAPAIKTPTPSFKAPASTVAKVPPSTGAPIPSTEKTPIPAVTPAPAIKTPTPSFKAPTPSDAPVSAKASKPSIRAGKRRLNIETLKKEIREEINTLLLKKGDLENELAILLKKEKRPDAYGIYVVRSKDNIWNIHYKFLTEYFGHRNIDLSGNADEPNNRGLSSGVGKILKFSEKMVYIYNFREHQLASNIDLIHPLSKVVVFNMSKVFELLKDIAYQDMDKIQFDGENIWLPAKN